MTRYSTLAQQELKRSADEMLRELGHKTKLLRQRKWRKKKSRKTEKGEGENRRETEREREYATSSPSESPKSAHVPRSLCSIRRVYFLCQVDTS